MPDPYSYCELLTLIKIYKSNVVTSAKSINCHVNYQNVNVALKYECSLLTVHLWFNYLFLVGYLLKKRKRHKSINAD